MVECVLDSDKAFIMFHRIAQVWFVFVVFFFLQDDFAHNREFITMVVYKTDGKKVYYPG